MFEIIAYSSQMPDSELEDTLYLARQIHEKGADHVGLIRCEGWPGNTDPALDEWFPCGGAVVAWKGEDTPEIRQAIMKVLIDEINDG